MTQIGLSGLCCYDVKCLRVCIWLSEVKPETVLVLLGAGFPVTDPAARHRFYAVSNWCYQLGVFVSRSSGLAYQVHFRQMAPKSQTIVQSDFTFLIDLTTCFIPASCDFHKLFTLIMQIPVGSYTVHSVLHRSCEVWLQSGLRSP